MSVLADLIYSGANTVAGLTEAAVNNTIAKYGPEKKLAFPDTACYFPMIYAVTGVKVSTLEDLPGCVGILKTMITKEENLDQALPAGLAAAMGAEILEGLKYAGDDGFYRNGPGMGFLPDSTVSSLGLPLVSGDIPGMALILGRAEAPEDLVRVVEDYQSRGLLSFLIGDCMEQCAEAGVRMGPEHRVIPLGQDVTALIHGLTVVVRTALMFGGLRPGDLPGLLSYTGDRLSAFVNTFGAIDAVTVSVCAGAIALGFPVAVDMDLAENQVPGALESVPDHEETVKRSMELGNIRPNAAAPSDDETVR